MHAVSRCLLSILAKILPTSSADIEMNSLQSVQVNVTSEGCGILVANEREGCDNMCNNFSISDCL
jgi:hypothetical protein